MITWKIRYSHPGVFMLFLQTRLEIKGRKIILVLPVVITILFYTFCFLFLFCIITDINLIYLLLYSNETNLMTHIEIEEICVSSVNRMLYPVRPQNKYHIHLKRQINYF